MARGERVEPHVGEFRSGRTFTRYYWQLELDEDLRPTGRDIVPAVHRHHAKTATPVPIVCHTGICREHHRTRTRGRRGPCQDARRRRRPSPRARTPVRRVRGAAGARPGLVPGVRHGAARPARRAPGWRSATAVLVVTGVLVAGAVAAAYAGLSADAKKAAAPNAQAAAARAPPPPPAAAPAQPPAARARDAARRHRRRRTRRRPPPRPPTPPKRARARRRAGDQAADHDAEGGPRRRRRDKPSPARRSSWPDAAQTYNPYARDPTPPTPSSRSTATRPRRGRRTSTAATPLVGVDLDLGESKGVRALQLVTATPGMTVEVYGARGDNAPGLRPGPRVGPRRHPARRRQGRPHPPRRRDRRVPLGARLADRGAPTPPRSGSAS